MNLKTSLLGVGLLAGVMPSAFAEEARLWTLDECVSYAIDHNLDVRQRQLDRQSGELDVIEARDAYLPTLNAGASQQFSFGRGLTSSNVYADRNTSAFGWNVNLQMPLFQGLSAFRQEKLAKANLLTLVAQVEAARDNVTLSVMASYLQALYNREIGAVAREQKRLSEVELSRREVLLENGKIAEVEVLEARSQLASDELAVVNADNDYRLSLIDLAQLLQIDDVEGFDIAPLTDEAGTIYSADEVYSNALVSNNALEASRLAIDAAGRQIELAKTGWIPTLSMSAGIGSSYYHLNDYENASFGSQMRDNYATSIGFSLNVPLFDAFRTRNSVRKARVQQLNAELAYDNARENVYKSIQTAYYQAVGAEKKLAASTVARESAYEAFLSMQDKYQFGKANATEFEQSKSAYIQALAQEVQARYELLLRQRILAFYNK